MSVDIAQPADPSPVAAPRSPNETAVQDLRGSPRHRTLLGGRLVYDNGACSLDCTIRDLSETGARVRLGGTPLIPTEVWLVDLRAGVGYAARVLWRRDREMGLGFTAAYSLDQSAPGKPELAAMRRLWVEHLAR